MNNAPLRLALIGLLLVTSAEATITRALSLKQLAGESDAIIRGRVTRQASSWNEAHTRIYTVSEIVVVETLKGQPLKALEVRQIGGSVEGITQAIAGNAKLSEGEEVLLFLDADEDPQRPYHYILGMAQGKYSVLRRAEGPPLIARDLEGLALARISREGVTQIDEALHPRQQPTLTLDAFRAQILDALKP
ncbi:hypothetical protein KKF91_01505 [Myxococcota bacterium]|nr:hypothetical protein [Myxococcota bacterium]MBU1429213.1 hypothetical protein [Myxococcota bacterium]MBU1900337.1 hypothetical protein [Myxococcota bacterium]